MLHSVLFIKTKSIIRFVFFRFFHAEENETQWPPENKEIGKIRNHLKSPAIRAFF